MGQSSHRRICQTLVSVEAGRHRSEAKLFLTLNLMHKASGYLSDPGSVGLLVAALGFQLSKGLHMARVDHPDENWTLAAINRSFDEIVISC
jgi:hypothetical protein